MQSTDTQTDATADLEKLSAEMATLGFQATLRAPQGDTACLTVRNPRASVLTEMVYADNGSFWWSWHEPIAGCDQVTIAAGILARVLRAVGELPVTSPTPEPTLASIHGEFPGWVCWRGASAMVYARRAKRPRNSGYDAKGEDAMDLRDQIIRAEALAHDEQA
jgi:hypothetical protein